MVVDLLARDIGPLDRAVAAAALRWPWCWPRQPLLRRAARRARPSGPERLPLGSALLLAVTAAGEPAGLFALVDGCAHEASWPLHGEARGALDRAARLVTRDLPLLVDTGALSRQARFEVVLVAKAEGGGALAALDGPSYGGAMLLACASRLVGVPAPADLVCAAALDDRGRLAPVADLGAKLDLVAGCALGVRRVVVAAEQAGEAERMASALPADRRPQVVPLTSAAALLDLGFGAPLRKADPPQWKGAAAQRAAEGLFRLALEGSPLLGWGHVARAGDRLARRLGRTTRPGRLAAFARDVARRHEHQRRVELPWPSEPDLAAMPAVMRQAWLAHVVQAAADGGSEALPQVLERSVARLPARVADHHDGDLRLRGAVGRGLARLRRYREARDVLGGAVDGWRTLLRPAEASRPLSELLRVLGVLRDRAGVRRAVAEADVIAAEPASDELTRTFLTLAAGRALVQVGHPGAGLTRLSQPHLALARGEVEAAALRWRAQAYQALGRPSEAESVRKLLARTAPRSEQVLLARLDAALAVGRSGLAQAAAVARAAPNQVRWLLDEAGHERWPALLAEEYPY